MSLVNEYKNRLSNRLGLSEEPITEPTTPNLDDNTVNAVLELVKREIAKKEAIGLEDEGMEDTSVQTTEVPNSADLNEAEQMADDIFFEMLNTFKTNVSNCEDPKRKDMYKKVYNHLYKMREKFLKEMITTDQTDQQ